MLHQRWELTDSSTAARRCQSKKKKKGKKRGRTNTIISLQCSKVKIIILYRLFFWLQLKIDFQFSYILGFNNLNFKFYYLFFLFFCDFIIKIVSQPGSYMIHNLLLRKDFVLAPWKQNQQQFLRARSSKVDVWVGRELLICSAAKLK
jgi:hypothetical protein